MVWPPTSRMVRVPGKKNAAPRAAAVRSVTWTSANAHLVTPEPGARRRTRRRRARCRTPRARPRRRFGRRLGQAEAGAARWRWPAMRAVVVQDHGLGVGGSDVDACGVFHDGCLPVARAAGSPRLRREDVVQREQRGAQRAHEVRVLADVDLEAQRLVQRLDHADVLRHAAGEGDLALDADAPQQADRARRRSTGARRAGCPRSSCPCPARTAPRTRRTPCRSC